MPLCYVIPEIYRESIRFYSLVTGKILQHDHKSFTLLKMPEDAICNLNTLAKNSPASLIFGDRHNNIDLDTDESTTGVDSDNNAHPNQQHSYKIKVNNIDDGVPLQDPTAVEDYLANNAPEIDEENSADDEAEDTQSKGVAPENAHNEVTNKTNEDDNDKDDNQERYIF